MKLNLLNNKVIAVCRYLLAALFLFSGITKAINPFGLSNQFGDYFNALGLGFLDGTQLAWAILLPAFEILLGLFLLFGFYKKLVSWAVLMMMSGFTVLTLWIAIENPVNDCGCFGEVLKISNWATFWKNIFFIIPTVLVFLKRNQKTEKDNNIYAVTVVVSAFLIPFYFLWALPPIDKGDYRVGANLVKQIQSGEGVFMLPILNENGDEIHSQFVNDSSDVMFVVSPKLKDINVEGLKPIIEQAKNKNIMVILLTAAPIEDAVNECLKLGIKPYNSDFTALKTMIQNFQGGLLLINKGVVIDKWSMSKLPNEI